MTHKKQELFNTLICNLDPNEFEQTGYYNSLVFESKVHNFRIHLYTSQEGTNQSIFMSVWVKSIMIVSDYTNAFVDDLYEEICLTKTNYTKRIREFIDLQQKLKESDL